ncbi:MAG: hypothetical protein QOG28_2235, partial [Trebonia sp.]|nr:hypothetical protein [Trebonia sp.]
MTERAAKRAAIGVALLRVARIRAGFPGAGNRPDPARAGANLPDSDQADSDQADRSEPAEDSPAQDPGAGSEGEATGSEARANGAAPPPG